MYFPNSTHFLMYIESANKQSDRHDSSVVISGEETNQAFRF